MVRNAAHTLAHRGTPATSTHTRVRWQPYASHQPIPARTPPSSYLVTPASSVSSSSPSAFSLCDVDRLRHAQYLPRESQLRETQKSKYALGLVGEPYCIILPISSKLSFLRGLFHIFKIKL